MNFAKIGVLLLSVLIAGCGSSSTSSSSDGNDSPSNISESAMAEAGQQSSSSEGASAPFMVQDYASDFGSMDFVDPASEKVRTESACTFSSARGTCTSNVDTIAWNNCSLGQASLSGGWTETWSAGFCADGTRPGALTNGVSVTRTSSSQVLTLGSGATLTTDTNAQTTYDGTALPSTGISISNSSGTRTIVINGLHKVMVGPKGRTLFDHSLKSTGLSVNGTRAAGTRVVTGSMTLYHNLAKYTAAHTFNSVTWGSPSCCYPTSGSISSTLTGANRSGNVTLAFTTTCGQATFTDTDSTMSTIALSQCN